MSSGIIPFLEGRNNAIKAWKADDYMPLEEVQQEYGIIADDLFDVGLLVEKGYWSDLQCYRYKPSKQGRLLLSYDEQYDIILIKHGCLEKLYLTVQAARSQQASKKKQWSESAVEQTRNAFEELTFAPRDGRIWLKYIDGGYGYINDDDALNGRYAIHSPEEEGVAMFDSVTKLIESGWVLD